jgi:hypothetical protein
MPTLYWKEYKIKGGRYSNEIVNKSKTFSDRDKMNAFATDLATSGVFAGWR